VVAAIFAAMGASMLGAFDLALPASVQGKMTSGAQRGGVIGAILMGMVTGLVASPCVGPVLVVLLTFVAKTGNLLFGFWLLFTFACGLGLLFLVLGTFASAINALPGAGSWMDTVKHVFGVILIAMAIYYVRMIIGPQATRFAYGAFLLTVGVYSGALTPLAAGVGGRAHFRKALAVLLFLAGALLFLVWLALAIGAPALLLGGSPLQAAVTPGAAPALRAHAGPAWRVNDEAALAEARAQGKPAMMDFYADWCGACVELDEKTWIDPAIITESQRFTPIKMDFTKRGPFMKAATGRYAVKGMPTVIFFDSQGNEATRFAGFMPAAGVLQIMQSVK
jgi:thiol:disulfide interchange protein DsbD